MKEIEKIKIQWYRGKPNVAKINIPIIKVLNVDVRKTGEGMLAYNIFDLYGKHVHMSFGDAGIELVPDSKLSKKPLKREVYSADKCVDCFSFKSMKQQHSLRESEYGKIGWATPLNGKALNNMQSYRKERNGSKTMYPVVLYGYIPQGTKYYKVKSYNKYYKDVDRYIADHIYLLPANEQIIVSELTGYKEFLKYIN